MRKHAQFLLPSNKQRYAFYNRQVKAYNLYSTHNLGLQATKL